MRQAVRFRTLLTFVLALAVLVPIVMVSLFSLWESRREAAAAREQAHSHAQLVSGVVERELEQARAAFGTIIRDAGDAVDQIMADPKHHQLFSILYVTDTKGNVYRYHARSGTIHWAQWSLPDLLSDQVRVLVAPSAAGRPEVPALAVAGRLPAGNGLVLLAELDPSSLRAFLQQYEQTNGYQVRLVAPSLMGDEPSGSGVMGQSRVADLPLEVHVLGSPTAEASWHGLWLTLALGALSVAVAILLARAAASPLSRPFLAQLAEAEGRLDQATRRLGESHLSLAEVSQQRSVDLGYSRATLYAVIESLNDGLVLITPDNRIRYINRHTEELLRLDEAFFPGRPAEELYAAVAAACDNPGEAREQLTGTAVLTVRSGSRPPHYLRWQTFRIRNATGADLGLGHLLTDVTQEREIDRVKSELISTVSHELRTPLTAIRASASSLLRQGVEWDEETRRDFLEMISEESGHLQELIENLLDMSKIEAGVLKLQSYPVELGHLADGVAGRARSLYPDLHLTLAITPGLPLINVDRRRMEQVLLNLIDNAVKYGADASVVEVQARQQGQEVWLTVHDEGIGIPPEHIGRLFQRFHRVDSGLTRDTGGSGLGLAICRGIVEAHGGRMWAESELGKGSTFFIALPVAREGVTGDEVQSAGG